MKIIEMRRLESLLSVSLVRLASAKLQLPTNVTVMPDPDLIRRLKEKTTGTSLLRCTRINSICYLRCILSCWPKHRQMWLAESSAAVLGAALGPGWVGRLLPHRRSWRRREPSFEFPGPRPRTQGAAVFFALSFGSVLTGRHSTTSQRGRCDRVRNPRRNPGSWPAATSCRWCLIVYELASIAGR